ncbi:6-methylsalicylic acid decarboxylase [Cladobotryum mycophilum]|uniref:6-methylsalicylate decarboxylase n=1 Tax=Cladobotryum mycophilum TaxID=491253 RepID=A0ABR0SX54_9HYPO
MGLLYVLQTILSHILMFFSKRVSGSRIDTHIHVLTPAFIKALEENGGDPAGWVTPTWTIEECIRFCDTVGSSFAVLSVTAPGTSIVGTGEEGRRLARNLNEEVWDICRQRPGRFGYFASLPDFNDVQGAVQEIERVYAEGNANGVVVMSSYGKKLLGDETFIPIWKALNKHKALVFVHPCGLDVEPERISGFLPPPVVDFPLATTRTAVSLVLSGTLTECQNVDVILSHGGGTLPYIGQRAFGSLIDPFIASQAKVNFIEGQRAASRFYYDLALSTSRPQLAALLEFTTPSKILYGSDFPYAPRVGIYTGLLQYARYIKSKEGAKLGPTQLNANAVKLLQKHRTPNCFLPSDDNRTTGPDYGLEESEQAMEARELLSKL